MKIWDLDRQFDRLIAFVLEGREKRKGSIKGAVESIKSALFEKKDAALIEFSRKWDEWENDYPLKVSAGDIDEALSGIQKKDQRVLKGMIRNVRAYHRGQKGRARTYQSAGLLVKEEFVPVERAVVYVPGGTAPYPSSVIMGVVPGQIAGVKEIVVTTPAKKGVINPYILAACSLLGIRDVYRIGGAQAIYAFAYGIGSIPKADMIVGPGNAYVEEAKREVYGTTGIDMLAGPTELIVLCADAFSPKAVAWDLFSQAEHDEMAMVGLFSSSRDHIGKVVESMNTLLPSNPRRAVIEKALRENSFFVHYTDKARAAEAINIIAPEHMELIGNEEEWSAIRYPGIIYMGPRTPVALGDYYIGTNHVLPTGGAGRFSAGLSVDKFMKRKVVVRVEKNFLDRHSEDAIRLSEIEGLYAHGESIKARKELP